MKRLIMSSAAALVLIGSAMAANPSGIIAVDCQIELKRHCADNANPSSHKSCLETRVKEVTPLCAASMEKNKIKRSR